MSTPQLEKGYTKIANEIMDALAAYRIPGEQRQCLDVILRKTYGYNKKEDCISNSQFVELTGLKKPSVCRALNSLIGKNIVSKKANNIVPSYQFNKNYKTWRPLAKKLTVSKKVNLVLAKKLPTKETLTKEKKKVKKIKFNALKEKPNWIEEKDWIDLVEHRKQKKAPLQTTRAINIIIKQLEVAKKEGFPVKACIDEMINRGWRGFKADWMKQKGNGQQQEEFTAEEIEGRRQLDEVRKQRAQALKRNGNDTGTNSGAKHGNA